jgi:hypothetical protein
MNRWLRRLAVIALTVLGSVLTFWQLLQIFPVTWKTSEYPAIAVWSLPLGLLILLVAKIPRRWLARRNLLIRLVASVILAAISAVVWTFLAVGLTGGYALAFDANPLICWAVGSVIGMLTALNWPATETERYGHGTAAI